MRDNALARVARDTSVGVSGRHDFGVRIAPFVGAALATLRSSTPIASNGPRLVTIAKRPSGGPGHQEMCG